MASRILGLVASLLIALAAPVAAHDARPFSINIDEQSGHSYLVRLRVPPTVELDNRPVIDWPRGCRSLNERHPEGILGESETQLISCARSLEGGAIAIRYPIYNPSLATLIRLKRRDGAVLSQLLAPDQSAWQVPARPSRWEVARGYIELGIAHIWGGIDHLLFVTGLLILAGSLRGVLLAITGFTLAHSLTLSLATLGLVRLPIPAVEATIALSILFLAREIARPAPDGLARRYPIAVSSTFGLLHGFGFAAALQEVGLPRGELATGLLCFNLGVEIGQIVYILAVTGLFLLLRRLIARRETVLARLAPAPKALAAYALGLPASYWLMERLAIMVN